ncbi:MAG TPA: hypothetical protein PLD73_03725, partial [Candidatus Hydrogenedentes bacterium]|nr:hypothetical protein [Candidatus Hydrogenedentota bacterium]
TTSLWQRYANAPPPPPPPTPEEIENEIKTTFFTKYQVLKSMLEGNYAEAMRRYSQMEAQSSGPGMPSPTGMQQQLPAPIDLKESIKADLQNAKDTHSNTDYGQKGLQRVGNLFERDIVAAYDRAQENPQMYDVLFMAGDLLQVLEPESSMLARYRQLAKDQINRPHVKVTGNTTMDGVTIWFLQVYLPETHTTQSLQVRQGDEFLGLRFVGTLGNNRAIELEYLKLNERFVVPAP